MHPPPRTLAAVTLAGLATAAALQGLFGGTARAEPAPIAGATLLATADHGPFMHAGSPDWAEVGYRSSTPGEFQGRIERDRDATGPIFVLIESDGRRLRIAYANNGDARLESALRAGRGSLCVVRGTVLDWGRGVRSFDVSKPLVIER